MDFKLSAVLEGTFVLIALFLIVQNAPGFSQTTKAIGGVYSDSVKALQGR